MKGRVIESPFGPVCSITFHTGRNLHGPGHSDASFTRTQGLQLRARPPLSRRYRERPSQFTPLTETTGVYREGNTMEMRKVVWQKKGKTSKEIGGHNSSAHKKYLYLLGENFFLHVSEFWQRSRELLRDTDAACRPISEL